MIVVRRAGMVGDQLEKAKAAADRAQAVADQAAAEADAAAERRLRASEEWLRQRDAERAAKAQGHPPAEGGDGKTPD